MLPTSKYLGTFRRMVQEAGDAIELIGDVILVEGIAEQEVKTASGLILQGDNRMHDGFNQNKPAFYYVLAVGKGYFTTDPDTGEEKTVPLNVQVGDIVLTGSQSVRRLSQFGPLIATKDAVLGLSREEDISIRFRGIEGYQKVYELLKQGTAQNA